MLESCWGSIPSCCNLCQWNRYCTETSIIYAATTLQPIRLVIQLLHCSLLPVIQILNCCWRSIPSLCNLCQWNIYCNATCISDTDTALQLLPVIHILHCKLYQLCWYYTATSTCDTYTALQPLSFMLLLQCKLYKWYSYFNATSTIYAAITLQPLVVIYIYTAL